MGCVGVVMTRDGTSCGGSVVRGDDGISISGSQSPWRIGPKNLQF